ncbi:MAG: ABC transporter permease, partial [Proteobacteria bacterium]|nr:ABC transporter permease [Pseudomonadota bacterium]
MSSATRLLAIVKKEVRQLRRDRLTFAMIFGLPIIQILMFGYAINTDVRNLKTAVVNQAGTHLSRQFIAELRETQVVNIIATADTPAALEAMLRRGEISIGVHIPRDFDRRVVDRDRAAVHLLVDGSDPTILVVANQLRSMPIRFDVTVPPPAKQSLVEIRPFYNPERRTPINIVPGLMGIILLMTMMLFTAVAIVRERERGLGDRIRAGLGHVVARDRDRIEMPDALATEGLLDIPLHLERELGRKNAGVLGLIFLQDVGL